MDYFLTFCTSSGTRSSSSHDGRRDQERRVHDLLRLARRSSSRLGRPDDGPPPADRAVVRRPVRRARPRRRRVAHRVGRSRIGRSRAVLYKFAVLNYFVDLPEPDPAARARRLLHPRRPDPGARPARHARSQFIRHDLWRKLRRRERFSKQEVGLALYGVLGIAFTIFSLYTVVLLLAEVFGGLDRAACGTGAPSPGAPVVLALFVAGPMLRGLITLLAGDRPRRSERRRRRSGSGSRRGGVSRRPS